MRGGFFDWHEARSQNAVCVCFAVSRPLALRARQEPGPCAAPPRLRDGCESGKEDRVRRPRSTYRTRGQRPRLQKKACHRIPLTALAHEAEVLVEEEALEEGVDDVQGDDKNERGKIHDPDAQGIAADGAEEHVGPVAAGDADAL